MGENEYIGPFISFIVPVYNVKSYLKQCVDSILSQSFLDIELILVDDGSTDGSEKICDDYAKKDARVLVEHIENGGASFARNVGINLAKGIYISFVDSDDWIAENSLDLVVKELKEKKIDVFFLEIYKSFEHKIENMNEGFDSVKINNVQKKDALSQLALLHKLPGSPCGKVIDRELIVKNKLFFIEGIVAEDLFWCVELYLKAEVFHYANIDFYYYRQDRIGSVTYKMSEKHFSALLNFVRRYGICDKVGHGEMLRSFACYEYTILLALYHTINSNEKMRYKKELKKMSYLLDDRKDKKTILVKLSYHLFGFETTTRFLNFYLKIR